MLLFVYTTPAKGASVIFTCRYFKLSWNTTALSQSNCRNFSSSSINTEISYQNWVIHHPRYYRGYSRKLWLFSQEIHPSELTESASFFTQWYFPSSEPSLFPPPYSLMHYLTSHCACRKWRACSQAVRFRPSILIILIALLFYCNSNSHFLARGYLFSYNFLPQKQSSCEFQRQNQHFRYKMIKSIKIDKNQKPSISIYTVFQYKLADFH